MAPTFAEKFALRTSERTSFKLNSEKDFGIFASHQGIQAKLSEVLERTQETPKLLVEGGWGSGKSHTLHHVAHVMLPALTVKTERRYRPVMLPQLALESKSKFADVLYRPTYLQLEEAFLTSLQGATSWPDVDWHGIELPSFVHEAANLLQTATREGSKTDKERARFASLRAWFAAGPITFSSTLKLGLGARLIDTATPDLYIRVLRAIARFVRKASGELPVLFFDEAASMRASNVLPVALKLNEGFRSLADPTNADLGLVLGLFRLPNRASSLNNDVAERMSSQRVNLSDMTEVAHIREFMLSLNNQLAREFWFTDAGLTRFAENLIKSSVNPERPGSLSPRDLLDSLQALASKVLHDDLRLPLETETVSRLVPLPKRAVA